MARQTGKLVSAREVEQRWATQIVAARTALLGIPSKAKSRLPHLTAADLATVDALIREALAELAEPRAHAAASPNGAARRRRARADVPPEPADASKSRGASIVGDASE